MIYRGIQFARVEDEPNLFIVIWKGRAIPFTAPLAEAHTIIDGLIDHPEVAERLKTVGRVENPRS